MTPTGCFITLTEMTTLLPGTVQRFLDSKGFGFILPDERDLARKFGAPDEEEADATFFFHYSDVLAAGSGRLSISEGTRVLFQPHSAGHGQRPRASRVQLEEGSFMRSEPQPEAHCSKPKQPKKTVKRPRPSEDSQAQHDEDNRIKRLVHQSVLAILGSGAGSSAQSGGGFGPAALPSPTAVFHQQPPAPLPFPSGAQFSDQGPLVTVPLSFLQAHRVGSGDQVSQISLSDLPHPFQSVFSSAHGSPSVGGGSASTSQSAKELQHQTRLDSASSFNLGIKNRQVPSGVWKALQAASLSLWLDLVNFYSPFVRDRFPDYASSVLGPRSRSPPADLLDQHLARPSAWYLFLCALVCAAVACSALAQQNMLCSPSDPVMGSLLPRPTRALFPPRRGQSPPPLSSTP